MRSFNSFINGCNLFDPLLLNRNFTWANCRAATRIDKFLLFDLWIEQFGCPRQVKEPRVTSDQ